MIKIPVFYTPKMVAIGPRSSPSAAKPAQVVASWKKLDVPLDIREPLPATRAQLELAHEPSFVRDVLSCQRHNGFGDTDPVVAASLPYTTGSMLSAAKHVLANALGAAAAPCSGFHHAGYDHGGGFCTFNGLVVTALALLDAKLVKRVGILDCDAHYGNGTDHIISELGLTWITHRTAGRHFGAHSSSEAFFRWLHKAVESMRGCDLVLYQAGADPHIHDPLGSGFLTTEEMRERDKIVFEGLKKLGIPVVWNLAGGYQQERDGGIPKVLEIHDNTMRECARVYCSAKVA